MRLLAVVFSLLIGCGTDDMYSLTKSDCGEGLACGNIYSQDLLSANATTIDALHEYLLNKQLSGKFANTPFKHKQDGNGDIDDLMWGLTVVKKLYKINPIFALALSIHESGWGTSSLAKNKNNLWGWNSGYCTSTNRCGDSFDKAAGFGSYGNGFNTVFKKIKNNYLTKATNANEKDGIFYQRCGNKKRVVCVGGNIKKANECGPTLAGMNCKYAADDNWGKLIRNHMNDITAYINNNVEPAAGCAIGVL